MMRLGRWACSMSNQFHGTCSVLAKDVTHYSLPFGRLETVPETTKQCIFWGFGSVTQHAMQYPYWLIDLEAAIDWVQGDCRWPEWAKMTCLCFRLWFFGPVAVGFNISIWLMDRMPLATVGLCANCVMVTIFQLQTHILCSIKTNAIEWVILGKGCEVREYIPLHIHKYKAANWGRIQMLQHVTTVRS